MKTKESFKGERKRAGELEREPARGDKEAKIWNQEQGQKVGKSEKGQNQGKRSQYGETKKKRKRAGQKEQIMKSIRNKNDTKIQK